MTGEGARATAAEELALAHEELAAADGLVALRMYRIALTRVYFAVFHAMRAALYATGLEPRTHSGTSHLFNLHFVKSGRVPAEASRIAARLQKYREEADYSTSFVIDESGAREELAAARALVLVIATRLAGDPTTP